ncbi:MAG: translation elongation factor Ts [Salinivirgaceae bacterium]|nr:translation elongation factor Ts [Salinivirgaceae bacterium]MDD4747036.1 translation elongation factor Ts [Salinivirgaceae bacterium]MDY0279561.1 translation elongation factor Ts [Salinivirgaceae bacterium]
MAITAAEVAKLRKVTGAGMMDCKKALEEANGDQERAGEIIREKGKLVAAKRADRDANEGVVLAKVSDDKKTGAIITLNCETDFVAKNADFIALAQAILDLALVKKPANLEALKALKLNNVSVAETIIEQVGVIGEKIDLSYFDVVAGDVAIAYIHPGSKLASLLSFNGKIEENIAKDIAMQTAAMSPVAIDKDDVPAEVVEKEIEIAREKARLEGKPENMLDKIAQGRLAKFFQESTLLNQDFVKEAKTTVRDYLAKNAPGVVVAQMRRFGLND